MIIVSNKPQFCKKILNIIKFQYFDAVSGGDTFNTENLIQAFN